jgi:ABC-2 type transport system ATP-binding protein
MAQILCSDLTITVENKRPILSEITFRIESGYFVAVLGENGAGKTTLLDTVMGFRKPNLGQIQVNGLPPCNDPYDQRQEIAYLSEKVDMPADWTAQDFLEFNRYFYGDYQFHQESSLLKEWGIRLNDRIVNLSAGEIRRVQIIAALCQKPRLFIIDEISAVLDIVGRRKFMSTLKDLHRSSGATILFATNILEDLEECITHLLILKKGKLLTYQSLKEFMDTAQMASLSDAVAGRIEES